MAAAAGIFNQQLTAGQALTGQAITPMDGSTSGTSDSGDSSGDSATITANDFLTLLVTEMQNQDPTADTDPNEYIDQLVQVNSLEQLIDINQTLTADSTPAASSSGSTASAQAATASANPATASVSSSARHSSLAGNQTSGLAAAQSAAGTNVSQTTARRAPGNLSVPGAKPAALRVAHALDGRSHAQPIGALSGPQ